MKINVLLLIGCAIPVSAATAWWTAALVAHPAPVPDGSAVPPVLPDTGSPRADTHQGVPATASPELAELRRQLQELRERVADLENRPRRVPIGETVSREDFEQLAEQVTRSGRVGAAGSPPSPEFKAQVSDALRTIQREDSIAKVRATQEQRAAQLEQRLQGLTETLSLSPRQTDAMRVILATRDQRETELIALWQAGADAQVLGETKQRNERELQGAVQQALSPAQWETFRSQRQGTGKQ